MAIRIDDFQGINPKLGDRAPQTAENCIITSGALVPLQLKGAVAKVHDGTDLLPDLPIRDVVTLKKASKPVRATSTPKYKATPASWLKIHASAHRTRTNASGIVETLPPFRWNNLPIYDVKYAGNQIIITSYWTMGASFGISDPDLMYAFNGPVFQLEFTGGVNGGPAESLTTPQNVGISTPILPSAIVPLLYRGVVYGYMQALDYDGPVWTATGTGSSFVSGTTTYYLPGTREGDPFQLIFNMNYVQGETNCRFIQTLVDSAGREGPESDLSDLMTIAPGERLEVTLDNTASYKKRLYRSVEGSGEYFLVGTFPDDQSLSGGKWEDYGKGVQPIRIPPNGNALEKEEGDADLSSFKGRVRLPDGSGMAYSNIDGKYTLWSSDYLKYHVWPAAWTLEMPEPIRGMQVAGGTVIVWTGTSSAPYTGKVYAVSGASPAARSYRLLSSSHPLLSPTGVCRMGDSIYYVTHDGVAEANGGGVRIVTEAFFTRESWWDFWGGSESNLAAISASVADGAILLEGASKNLRLDLTEGAKALTTWTGTLTSSGKTLTWKSQRFKSERKTTFDGATLNAPGSTATLKVYANGNLVSTATLSHGTFTRFGNLPHDTDWEFQLESTGTIHSLTIFERHVVTRVDGKWTFTPQNVEMWENLWIKVDSLDAPVAGFLSAQTDVSWYLDIHDSDGTLLRTVAIPASGAFQFDGVARKDLYRLTLRSVGTDPSYQGNRIDELTLYTRQPVVVNGSSLREVHDGGMVPWWTKRYITGDAIPKWVRVHARQNVTLRAWFDGKHESADPSASYQINETIDVNTSGTASRTKRLAGTTGCGSLAFNFLGNDDSVWDVEIGFVNMQTIDGPVVEMGGQRGNLFRFPDRGTFAAMSVLATNFGSGSSITLYKDGVQHWTDTLNDIGRYLMPFPRSSRTEGAIWECDVDAVPNDGVQRVRLYAQQVVPGDAQGIIITQVDPQAPQWIYTDWKAPEGMTYDFASARVIATDYTGLQMRLYAENATTPTRTIDIADGAEFYLSGLDGISRIGFDFNGNDHKVVGLQLNNREVIAVPVSGVVLSGRRAYRNIRLELADNAAISVAKLMSSGETADLRIIDEDAETYLQETLTTGVDKWMEHEVTGRRRFDIDLDYGEDEVYALHLVGRMTYEMRNGVVVIPRAEPPFTYLDRRVVAPDPEVLTAARVESDTYPIRLWIYSGKTRLVDMAVQDGKAFRLPRMGRYREYGIHLIAPEGAIIQKAVFATSMAGLRA